jgi:hypothetical protein
MDRRSFAALVAITLAVGACKSGAMDSAKEDFAKKYTCPEDRVEARIREDVTATQVYNRKPSTPPAEVASDPARLALWRKQQSDSAARDNDGHHVVEVRGCGHHELDACGYVAHHASTSSPWMCMTYEYPPGVKKW